MFKTCMCCKRVRSILGTWIHRKTFLDIFGNDPVPPFTHGICNNPQCKNQLKTDMGG